jgi:membrane protein DedA with SNARE-associated domain
MHISLTSEARFPLPDCAKAKTAKRNGDELPSRTVMEESIFAKRSQEVIETQATPNPGRTNTQAPPALRRPKNAFLPNEPENLLKAIEIRQRRTQRTQAGPNVARPNTKITKQTQSAPDSGQANTEPAAAFRLPINAFLPSEPENLLKTLETRQFRTQRTQRPLENRAPLHVQTPAPVFYKTNPMRTQPPMHNRCFLMSADQASTPLMRQCAIRQQVSGALLMFRLGDFYELFRDDAIIASRELEAKAKTWGSAGIFFSRWLVSPLGPWINFASGAGEFPWLRFTFWDVVGKTFRAALYIELGRIFSDRVQEVGSVLGDLTWAIVGILAAAVIGWKLFFSRAADEKTSSGVTPDATLFRSGKVRE